MAAIATAMLAYVRPGETVLHSRPLYGGTETLLLKTLAPFGVKSVGFTDGLDEKNMRAAAERAGAEGRVAMIFIETPSNPMNSLVDIALVRRIADGDRAAQGSRPILCCDNTLLGPVFQSPLRHGADLSLYSLTKYVGGHSDLIGGAVLGSGADLQPIRAMRSAIGTQLDPHSCWMLARSLETAVAAHGARCHQRGERGAVSGGTPEGGARALSAFAPARSPPRKLMERQSRRRARPSPSTSKGGQAEAFAFLNRLQLFKLAVSLGGTESLICHPVDDGAFRTDRGGAPRDRHHAVTHPHVDRRRAPRRSHRRYRPGFRGRPLALLREKPSAHAQAWLIARSEATKPSRGGLRDPRRL